MKNFFTAFVVFMVWSLFGLWIYSWLQTNNETAVLLTNETENISAPKINKNEKKLKSEINDSLNTGITETKKSSTSKPFKTTKAGFKATNLEGDIIFYYEEGVIISKNKTEIIIPKSSINYKYKINTYLLEHPGQELYICSIYSPLEDVSTPNIGIKRASIIEKQLLDIGISKEIIVKKSIIKNIDFTINNTYNNGVYFSFKHLDTTRIEALKKSIPNSKTMYPKFTESGISVNNELQLLLSELIIYFNEHPNKKITIVGHTDNIGNANDNYAVGLKYAQQIRRYLISKGDLNKSLIIATSKGESEPIGDNNSKQGRLANKRIEVLFN